MLVTKSCSQVHFKQKRSATLSHLFYGDLIDFLQVSYNSWHLVSNSSICCLKMAQTHFPNQSLRHAIEGVNKMFVLDFFFKQVNVSCSCKYRPFSYA